MSVIVTRVLMAAEGTSTDIVIGLCDGGLLSGSWQGEAEWKQVANAHNLLEA